MTYLVYGPTNAAGSLTEVLVKEDVSDLITNLFPLDTPLHQILMKVPMNNVFTEQPVDSYATTVNSGIVRTNASIAVNTGNAAPDTTYLQKPEGHTFATSTPFYPARLRSVAEIQGIQFAVSDTDRAMSQYGVGDRYTYEALKTTRSVVNNFETSFWWSLGTPPEGVDAEGGGSTVITTVRNTQGVMPWILVSGLQRDLVGLGSSTHTDGHGNEFGTANAALNASSSQAYDAAGLTLDQTMFKEQLMSKWWTNTGRTGGAVGFAGPKIKNLFSQFALTANGPVNERTLGAASKLIVDTVDYYETDFGLVSINLCRYLGIESQTTAIDLADTADVTVSWDESLVFMHPEYWNIGVVRGVTFTPLAKTGDFETGLVRGEQALICRNPMAGAAIVNAIP